MNRREAYEYLKKRRDHLLDQVVRLLGGRCARCNAETNDRIEFQDLSHPYRKQYMSNKATLWRMVLDGEFNSGNLKLLCNDCWIENRREAKDDNSQTSETAS